MNKNRIAKPPQLDDPASWVDKYGDFLYRSALSRVKDPSIAEDIVQETFLAALKSRANFQGRSTARTWLIAILKHKIVDHIRKRVREPASDKVESLSDAFANDPIEGNFKDDGGWLNRPAKWDVNPMKIYEQKEFMDILYRCLSDLPERQAEAFMMRELHGLSTEEICKALNISATNSWVILYRARMWLRQCIGKNWLDADN
jgi:RNA polymerase sigma-70 factor (ECF subfamily)